MMQFEIPKNEGSIIKVIGVGGGGSNAVNHMFQMGIKGVDFIICNTDRQALDKSPVPIKIQLGSHLTKGLGAGSNPDVGRDAAIESIDDIKEYLGDHTQMVFITAGLGGGTGTGAAPVIASIAKELGILTVGIVTLPFMFEGKKRKQQADNGLEELKKYVDTLLIIGNDKLREIYGNLKMSEAFAHADNVLTNAAKSIAEIISLHMHINVDFNDVKTVMKESGVAIMGSAVASGEKRALRAVEESLNSPLLNDNDISGARHVLLNIMSGSDDIDMDEFGEITDFIQEAAGGTAELITGYGTDPSLGDSVSVTIIATGFKMGQHDSDRETFIQSRKVVDLNEEKSDSASEIEESVGEVNEPFMYVKEEEVSSEIKNEKPVEKVTQETTEVSEIIVHTLETSEETNVSEISTQVSETEFTFNMVDESSTQEKTTEDSVNEDNIVSENVEEVLSREEQIKRAQERIRKLKEISLKMKSPEGLAELENQTAFSRKNITIEDKNYSNESSVSRYTLGEGNDNKTEIKPNNSFLHDNVD
ncbi:MAG: cell division protein FtsZ [Bacteroidia bacterium]